MVRQVTTVRLSAWRIAYPDGVLAAPVRCRFRAMSDLARGPFPAMSGHLFAAAVDARRTTLSERGCGPPWVPMRWRLKVPRAHPGCHRGRPDALHAQCGDSHRAD